MNRLDKTMVVPEENIKRLQEINSEMIWLVISEGWCGDAAQILPIIHKMAEQSEKIDLKISMMELFNGEKEPMTIQSIGTENTKINILFNKDGIGNYDIAIKKEASETNEKEKTFALSIQNYEVENLKFTYKDAASKMKLVLDSINHEGTGNFEQEVLDLDTKTTAKVTFDMDKSNFMRNVPISLEAILGVDLKNSKYTFKENKVLINQLPLHFNGFIQMVEKGQVYDLTFNTPSSDFKNFLGLIPSAYAGNLVDFETSGKFEVKGKVKGNLSDTTVPSFDIEMLSNNASFKYKELPKSVKNISINTHIVNETGLTALEINEGDTKIRFEKTAAAFPSAPPAAQAGTHGPMPRHQISACWQVDHGAHQYSAKAPHQCHITGRNTGFA